MTTYVRFVSGVENNAVLPSKAHSTDSGFDVTVIGRKNGNDTTDNPFKVVMFRTGLQIQPPTGYYFELVPRSSLQKMGYTLANCVGIIDNEYRGEIFVPLYKFDPDAKDLELPTRVAQLIPRKIENMTMEYAPELFTDTVRGENGFGSTGH